MSLVLTEGRVDWIQDLAGSTAATPYPSASTDGVGLSGMATGASGHASNRLFVMARVQITTGTLSCTVPVYGYSAQAGNWSYLGSLNGGSSIAASTSKWSPDASTAVLTEYFSVAPRNFERFATRCIPGTNHIVSTWVGIPLE
jgi:hypothetical protein